jgi:demethylmenaquinone methyltransferase/2-methoxy-6-polyprenyl-1,4-benzoquinol methylase
MKFNIALHHYSEEIKMDTDHTIYTTDYFARWGRIYDLTQIPYSRIREKAVNITNAPKGALILDVATGTGRQAFAFAKRGYQVIGIDLLPEMLKVAIRKNKYPNMKFEVADAAHIPFGSDHFDVSVICVALHDMSPTVRENVLREMVRVTKPKGSIVIIDYRMPKNKIWGFLVYHYGKIYETKYFPEFMHSDLYSLLKTVGISRIEEHIVAARALRIIKGKKKIN